MHHGNNKHNKAGVAMLTADKVDLNTIESYNAHFIGTQNNHNKYKPTKSAVKWMKQKLTELKEK